MVTSSASTTRRRRRVFGAVLLALVATTATMNSASAAERPVVTPEERASALGRPAVVYLEQEWSGYVIDHDGDYLNGGRPFTFQTRCSGFVVNPSGYIVSAGHCFNVEENRRTFIELGVEYWIERGWATRAQAARLFETGYGTWKIEGEAKDSPPTVTVYAQRGVATSGLRSGQALPARVISASTLDQGDVALLKVEQENMSSVLLAPPGSVEIGTPILLMGYPGSADDVTDQTLEPSNKDGKISAKRTRGSVPFYEVSAAMTGGQSGGQAINMDGQVVGLVSFSPADESQAFNFIAPTSMIHEMLSRNGVKNELSRSDVTYRRGLDQYFAGEYAKAMETFDQVLSIVPSHQQAQEFRQKAAERKADEPAKSGGGLALLGGVAIAILVTAVIGVVVLRASRNQRVAARRAQSGRPPVSAPSTPAYETPAYETASWGDGNGAVPPAAASRPAAPAVEERPSPSRARAATDVATRVQYCSTCGAAGEAGAQFCARCGSALR